MPRSPLPVRPIVGLLIAAPAFCAVAIAATPDAAAQSLALSEQRSHDFGLSAGVGYQRGHNTFGLYLSDYSADVGGRISVRSELEWPMAFPFVSGALRVPVGADTSLQISATTNIAGTSSTMDDSDWIAAPSAGVPKTKFAYTESEVKLRSITAEIALAWPLRPNITLVAGYRHEYYRGDAYGAEGWVLSDGGAQVPVELTGRPHAAQLESHHALPFGGASYKRLFEGRLYGVYMRDHDDHLLRFKHGTGNAVGLGLQLAATPRWRSGLWSLGFDATVHYLRGGFGTLEQEFYADDPDTPEDELTSTIPDSDYYSRSVRAAFLLVAELNL